MKRKANKELPRTPNVQKSEIASIVTPIVPNGDLQLDFSKDLAQPLGLLVSRYILCIASPVFNAMLGDDSHFSESTSKVSNADGVQVVRLDDDSYTLMEIMMNVVHLQGNKVPQTLLFPQLDLCAGLCDKYDMAKSLGRWPDIWMEQYLHKVEDPGYERWLFISSIFEQKDAHAAITKHIVLNATTSDTLELLYRQSSRFSEGVAASILEWIAETRIEISCKLLMLCWHAMCRLQGEAACTLRRFNPGDNEVEDCEAVNRGCLTREFPDARYPKRSAACDSRSIVEIHDAIKRIRHLDAMSGLDAWFARQHRACDVGYPIQAKADAFVKEVVGRRLKPRRFELTTPRWFDTLFTELRILYPHANLEAQTCDVIVDALADSVSVRNIEREGPAGTVNASMPTLRCIDCSDVWMFPGPEKIGKQIEDHMKSGKHLERVYRRLDLAWQPHNGE